MRPLLIVGRGDHARVMLEAARAAGHDPIGFLDPTPGESRAGTSTELPLLGDLELDLQWRGAHGDASFVVAIGDNEVRKRAYDRALGMGLRPETIVHPSATLLAGCTIGGGSQICAGVVVGVDARVGSNVIINTAATVDHDNDIGDHVSVGPGAHLAGRVLVGVGAQVGIGVSVREGMHIGAGSVVGAGAAVTRSVAPGVTVVGVPARPMGAAFPPPEESSSHGG
jgi:sugar O-acyltransferase (sialic acid O-acetyltransferase NeuD family)